MTDYNQIVDNIRGFLVTDYNEIVDKIRSFVQSNDQTRQDFLPALAAGYAEACAQVNQRLTQCNRLLQQGLRSEAIHQAEGEPRLLDAVTTLDFPERAAWEEVVELYGFTASSPLTVDLARFLNEAYAEEDPIRDLLRSHRRQALARGPLPERLAVLRKMAALDASNPVWPEDVRTFEKARLRQIQTEAAKVAGRRDLVGLDLVLKELEAKHWSERPPAILVQGIKKSATQIRRTQARAELATLEIDLNNAFAAFDVEHGRQVRQRWNTVVPIAGVPTSDPVRDRAEPALQWLAEQDRREQNERDHGAALMDLESTLDDDSPDASELERLAHAVSRHEVGMPEPLERRLRNRLENLELVASRRRRLIVATSAVAILLVCGASFYVVHQQNQAREVTQAVATINQMLTDGEVEQASEFIDKLETTNAGLFRSPVLVEAKSQTRAAQAKETERAEKFAKALTASEVAAASEQTPAALIQARSLARLDREKAAVERFARRHEIDFRADRAARDEAILPQIDAASQAVWHAEALAGKSADLKAADEAVAEARGKLAELGPEISLVSDSL
ncbi:MAG: hypothetical protein ABI353_12645, partial [Isosphaeraceae bacterium]